MIESFNRLTFNLLEATVSVYAQTPAGQVGALLAADLRAENLRVNERWVNVQTRPTGAPFAVNHPLVAEYALTIGRLLAFDGDAPAGIVFTSQSYVVDVVWVDEDGRGWHRATFYGVTISSRDQEARDVEAGMTDQLEFAAQLLVPAGGSGGTPGAPETLPLTVRFVSAVENCLLYVFANGCFRAVNDPADRATIGNDFAITFAGHPAPALSLAAGKLRTYDVEVGSAPRVVDLPRLDFFAGTTWLGSVTERGKLFCDAVTEVDALESVAGFRFGDVAIWGTDGLQVTGLEEFFPADLTGLQAWHRLASLDVDLGAPVRLWPDATEHSHNLAATGSPKMTFLDGQRAIALAAGDYFHCSDLFDTSALHLFVVARRARGMQAVPVAGLGGTGDGSLRWTAGKQAAVWQHGGAIAVNGTRLDGNAWSLYELEKGATGTALRLNGQLDAFGAHGAFGSDQEYFLAGDPAASFGGYLREALVFDRTLEAVEADQLRLWLRSNLNLP